MSVFPASKYTMCIHSTQNPQEDIAPPTHPPEFELQCVPPCFTSTLLE